MKYTTDVSLLIKKHIACKDPNSISGKLFGVAGDSDESRPSRLIVRDAELDVKSADFATQICHTQKARPRLAIDRVTAIANTRTFERVLRCRIQAKHGLNIFEGEDEDELKQILQQAIDLLHDDYLEGMVHVVMVK